MSRSILLVPSVAKGNGSGHIVRCLSLARALGSGASVFVPETASGGSWSAAELSLAYSRELAGIRIVSRLPAAPRRAPWDLIVLDRRATGPDELSSWERFAPVVAIDEGGGVRARAHYLIDILPRHPRAGGGHPNRSGLGLLDLPLNRRAAPREFRRVLVSFGGEDGANLGLSLARLLLAEAFVAPSDLTIVSGALRRGAPPVGLEGATLLGPVQDLKEHLSRYDLVFTQFGLTAFEAAWAGCGVILLNPGSYHRELARAAASPEIGIGRPDRAALRRYMRSPASVLSALERVVPHESQSLADCVSGLAPAGSRDCPACSSPARRALYRDAAKSVFRCASCGTVYTLRFSQGREHPYTEAYFFEEYSRQYGKTYLEDWPALSALADSRLSVIERLAQDSLGRAKGLSVLDVGCAYGPFLAASRARGQRPFGLDAAEAAAAYVRRELGIPAVVGDFSAPSQASSLGAAFGAEGGPPFDVISMWYVVEHFERLDQALETVASLLRPGGIFALSTPSLEGASGRFAREAFLANSPADHFTIWEPSRVRALLKAFGFRVLRIRITGHHAERLPGLRFLASRHKAGRLDGPLSAAGRLVSRVLRLGDTFEVYAVREPSGAALPAGSGQGAVAQGSAADARIGGGQTRGPKGR